MVALTIFVISLLPLKGSYLGFRVTSFAHVPTSFMAQYEMGRNSILNLSTTFGLSQHTGENKYGDTLLTRVKDNEIHFRIQVGYLSRILSRPLYTGNISGLVGIRPYFNFTKSTSKTEGAQGSRESSSRDYNFGGSVTIGSLYSFKIGEVDMAFEFLADMMSFGYRTTENETNGDHTTFSGYNFRGINFTSGDFAFYVMFKL